MRGTVQRLVSMSGHVKLLLDRGIVFMFTFVLAGCSLSLLHVQQQHRQPISPTESQTESPQPKTLKNRGQGM